PPLFTNTRPTPLPDSRSTCPPCRHQPLVSPPLILPVPLLLPRLPALRASHGVGRRTLARRPAVDAIVVAKLHLQIHRPPPASNISRAIAPCTKYAPALLNGIRWSDRRTPDTVSLFQCDPVRIPSWCG